jgi:hypothetical protein
LRASSSEKKANADPEKLLAATKITAAKAAAEDLELKNFIFINS